MDIIIGIISLILAVVCGIVVYFISVSSMREKTYDEVKAEQKKKNEEYLAPGRSAKDKAKDKKVKKAVKKSKEINKAVQSGIAEPLEESVTGKNHLVSVQPPTQQIAKDRVQEEPKENIIESVQHFKKAADNQINVPTSKVNTVVEHSQKSFKSLQKPAEKPVKITKVSQQEELPIQPKSDQKQKMQSNNIQENQVKLKVSDKAIEVKAKNLETAPDNQRQPQTVVKEVPKSNAKPQPPSTGSGNAHALAKISRKKRNDISSLHQINGDRESVDAGVLTSLVVKSEMTGTEIQDLIECLLNKQLDAANVDSPDWSEGRQDPVVRLKKQLAEKERAVTEEQEAAAALQSKLRDLRNELNAARATARQHEEAYADSASRLQHAADEKQTLLQQIQQLQRKLAEEHRLLCQAQADQEQQLQHELLAQRQQLEIHITRLTEKHQEEARTQLEHLMSKLQYETTRLQGEVGSLQEQLAAKRTEAEQLAAVVQALQADNTRLTAQISSACVEAQQLRDENVTLSAQVVTVQGMERPATEGMEQNGDNGLASDNLKAQDKITDADVLIEKLREDLDLHEKELSRCKSELSQRESLISDLKRDLDKAHANTESFRNECKFAAREQESTIKTLREEKDSAHKLAATLREEVGKSEAEVRRLSRDLESKDSQVEALKSELNTHKTRIADQVMTIEALRADTQSDELRRALDSHQQETEDKAAKISTLTSQVAAYKGDVTRLQGALDTSRETTEKFSTELKELMDKYSSVSQELKTLKSEHSGVCQKLESLKSDKNEAADQLSVELKQLMEKHSSVCQELKTLKCEHTSVCQKLETLKSEKNEAADRYPEELKQLTEKHSRVCQELEALKSGKNETADRFPEEFKELSEKHSRVCQELEAVKVEHSSVCQKLDNLRSEKNEGESESLEELLSQNGQLQSLVAHYKAIIGDTEAMLNQLQSHVEREETRWRQEMRALQAQLLTQHNHDHDQESP